MSLTTLTVERGIIAVIEMNDPPRYNALTSAMVVELKARMTEVRDDRTIRAAVLTGAGRGFCAGANMAGDEELPELARNRGPVGRIQVMQEQLAELILAIHELPVPVIAAVHGAAVGGGLALALASDLRVASP